MVDRNKLRLLFVALIFALLWFFFVFDTTIFVSVDTYEKIDQAECPLEKNHFLYASKIRRADYALSLPFNRKKVRLFPVDYNAYWKHPCEDDFDLKRELFDLSIIMVNRLDTYGGKDLTKRAQNALDWIDFQLKRNALKSHYTVELVIVDYNSPPDEAARRPIQDMLNFPSLAHVVIVTVPPEHHRAFCRNKGFDWRFVVPVLEFYGKNIGIRRSSGRFILPHAMDTIISQSWWDFFFSGGLHKLHEKLPRRVFRMVRVDIGASLPLRTKVQDFETFLACHGQKIHTLRSFRSNELGNDPLFCVNSTKVVSVIKMLEMDLLKKRELFFEASGDFELMHRSQWFETRGYIEHPTYAHFDSLLLLLGRSRGILQHVLGPNNMYVFHQFHESGGFSKRVSQFQETKIKAYTLDSGFGPNFCDWGAKDHQFVTKKK